MRIRHTVIFTLKPGVDEDQATELVHRLKTLGEFCEKELGVTDWSAAKIIPDMYKDRRGHVLQDGIFPDTSALDKFGPTPVHMRVRNLAEQISDWKVIDTWVD